MIQMSHYSGMHGSRVALIARALASSLADIEGLGVAPASLGRLFGTPLWTIEVTLPNTQVITLHPGRVDNGANGVREEVLVAIRQACGEAIDLPNRSTRTDPYRVFNDIMAVDQHD